ncbi:MAG TPA: C40 family peptidase [Candidatus Limisoma gallistercoris]|nr:C40 family peptidase [Candidatus Limisoma gallistercoris]
MFAKKSIIAVLMMSLSMPIYSRIVADDVIKDVKQQYAPDTRVAVWSVTADKQSGNSVVLRGKTDNPDAKDALLRGLKAVNIAYKDSITLLPDATVEKPWALVTISVACLRGEPRSGAELVSQAIMGTPVKVLECDGGMSRVQTPDGYIAYVTDSSLQFLSADGFAAWKKARRVVVTANLSMAYEKPVENIDAAVSDLLLGNILEYKGETAGFVQVSLPDGRTGYVKETDVKEFSEWAKQNFDMPTIERSARRMMGTPYLWGGMSAKMADCSGFVRTAYFSNGIILQRDASQQALTGKKIDPKKWRTEAEPGDLIFIGTKSGKVTHVAMYIGNGKYIHSSGRVKINSMDKSASDFLDYNFLSMSRIKGEVGTKGIVAVRNHEWYFNK